MAVTDVEPIDRKAATISMDAAVTATAEDATCLGSGARPATICADPERTAAADWDPMIMKAPAIMIAAAVT